MVAPVPMDSSSGWAWTSSSRRESPARTRVSLPAAPAGKIGGMTDGFPRQQAKTQGFSLGAPRSFQISPDGSRVAFLRSKGGDDPVTCLWVLDAGTGHERLAADPATLGAPGAAMTDQERAIRERTRERAAGIVGFATDAALTVAAFTLAGRVYLADLTGPASPRAVPARAPAFDPRPDPTGRRVAYVCEGALRVTELATGADTEIIGPDGQPGLSLRPRRVHRGRGNGPGPGVLVGAGRHGPAGGQGGQHPRPALVHHRPGQPGPARDRGRLPGGGHRERRRVAAAGRAGRQHEPAGVGPPRIPLPGGGELGPRRPAGGGAEPRPGPDAPAVRGRGPGRHGGAAGGHRRPLAGHRAGHAGPDQRRPDRLDRRRRRGQAAAGREPGRTLGRRRGAGHAPGSPGAGDPGHRRGDRAVQRVGG